MFLEQPGVQQGEPWIIRAIIITTIITIISTGIIIRAQTGEVGVGGSTQGHISASCRQPGGGQQGHGGSLCWRHAVIPNREDRRVRRVR